MVELQDGRTALDSFHRLRDSRQVRWTGETRWKHSWLPAALNQEYKVFSARPTAVEISQLSGTERDVCLKGKLAQEDIAALGAQDMEKLEFSGVRFPLEWDSRLLLPGAKSLTYLSFNGGSGFVMSDGLRGIAELPSLETLHLHRSEFMNHGGGEAYRRLASMHQLRHLSLDRTITLEKAPGSDATARTDDGRTIRRVAELDPVVVDSLVALLGHGNLRTLSLRWCSALQPADRQRLQAAAQGAGCRITF
ncbi:hypothetical protein M4R22_08960 [Acidovorax sp. GBBC 3334]|uniref:hypothetical protein n=1 Tax=Acidovorax sp. GBBC 3334 TaxID=2940496 RepID=UPI0023043F66|nr:hypothetical protein [Acidovorax sp. GBBC 3334]MDA8454892.1 hypothetical protein [Acidovorax sp. GBBC 3334]